MKTSIKIAASAALVSPLLLVGSVYARTHNSSADATLAQTQTEQTEPTATPNTPEKAKAELKKRLEERKNQLKLRLNAAELRRLQQRCKPAQGQIKKAGDEVKANIPQRHRAYENLSQQLGKLIEKLDAQGVATADLKSHQTELDQKITKYKADVAAYQQALDDLSAMDCTTDPTAFKASLEAARQLRADLNKSITDIHTYAKETIKPALVELRKSLADKEEES